MQRAGLCEGDLLLLQDTTELDYSTHKALRGSGPISDKSRRGFFLHNRLLVAEEEALVLGVCSAQTWARLDAEHGKGARRRSLPIEEKESMRWLEGYDDACALAAQFPERKIIMVADRECDLYELYVRRQERPQADFIVRACRDRVLLDEGYLFEKLHAAPLLGGFEMEVHRKEQTVKIKESSRRRVREGRLARMEVRAMPVHPRPPQRKGIKLPEVELCAVLVAEKNPPKGQEPIEWLLLTTLPAQDVEGAMRIVRAYTRRWLVEEFHRVLKSGCRIEALTLRESGALLRGNGTSARRALSFCGLALARPSSPHPLRGGPSHRPFAHWRASPLSPPQISRVAPRLRRRLCDVYTCQGVAGPPQLMKAARYCFCVSYPNSAESFRICRGACTIKTEQGLHPIHSGGRGVGLAAHSRSLQKSFLATSDGPGCSESREAISSEERSTCPLPHGTIPTAVPRKQSPAGLL